MEEANKEKERLVCCKWINLASGDENDNDDLCTVVIGMLRDLRIVLKWKKP